MSAKSKENPTELVKFVTIKTNNPPPEVLKIIEGEPERLNDLCKLHEDLLFHRKTLEIAVAKLYSQKTKHYLCVPEHILEIDWRNFINFIYKQKEMIAITLRWIENVVHSVNPQYIFLTETNIVFKYSKWTGRSDDESKTFWQSED